MIRKGSDRFQTMRILSTQIGIKHLRLDTASSQPITTKNRFETLTGGTVIASPRGSVAQTKPKEGKMPPIEAKRPKVETSLINAIKAQTSELVYFEYAASGLRVGTANAADHQSVISFPKSRGIEFYSHEIR